MCGRYRIRTCGPNKRPRVFKTPALDRSANLPKRWNLFWTLSRLHTKKIGYKKNLSNSDRIPITGIMPTLWPSYYNGVTIYYIASSYNRTLIFLDVNTYSVLLSVFVSLECLSSMLQVGLEPTTLNIVAPSLNNSFIHSHTLGIDHCVATSPL